MNLDIQPNTVTILINADSIQQAIQQLVRAKVALQTMITPPTIRDDELPTLLTDLASRLAVDHVQGKPAATSADDESTEPIPGEAPEPAPAATDDLPPLAELQEEFNKAGQDLFGNQWAQASPWLVQRYTTKFTADNIRDRLSKLSAAEVADLITRLIENATAFQSAWAEHKQTANTARPRRKTTKRSTTEQANHERMAHPANVVMATG